MDDKMNNKLTYYMKEYTKNALRKTGKNATRRIMNGNINSFNGNMNRLNDSRCFYINLTDFLNLIIAKKIR